MTRSLLVLLVPLLGACGTPTPASSEPMPSPATAPTPPQDPTPTAPVTPPAPTVTPVPTNGTELVAWLDDEVYLTWDAESAPHESTGPHFGAVQTFVGPTLFDSLDAGSPQHPVGSAVVKELYGSSGSVQGFAVMVKITEGTGGDSWYWYEDFNGTVFSDAVGDGQCTGCHSAGTDFVLTPFPLQ